MKWKTAKLKDCCESITDGDHQAPPRAESGIPFIIISDINQFNRIDFTNARYVPKDYYDALDKKRKPQKDDVLYTVKGSFGIPVYVRDNKPFVFQRDIAIIKCKKRINPLFLFYTMKSKQFYQIADGLAIGSAQRAITLGTLKNMTVPIPSLIIQERIAKILSAYDDLIENNQKQIKLLEEAAQRLYKEWFVDLRFPGHENTPIVNGIPVGWGKRSLGEIADVIMGQSPKSEFYNTTKEGLPFHQGVGSYGNRFVIDEVYSTFYTRIAESRSILFSVRAPVGRLNITRNKIVIGRGIAAITHRKGMQSFLFYMLKERFFKDNLVGNGSIFDSISKDELLKQEFVVPEVYLAQEYDSIVVPIDKKISLLDKGMTLLAEARDRILSKLMNGEIEI